MSSAQTSLEQMLGVYKWVVDDVVVSVKEEFLNESVDGQVLEDLKTLWEQKLVRSGALSRPPKESNPPQKADHHDKAQKSTSSKNHHHQQQHHQQKQHQPQQHVQQHVQLDTGVSVIQQPSSVQATPPQPPPLITLQSQNTPSVSGDSTRRQSNKETSSQVQSQSGGDMFAAQQAALYSAMAAGIQPLMLPSPAGAGGLTLPMLQQPYAAVQTPTGLSYMPLPMALNLQQQQQQIESRNKETSSNIPQNDGPVPLSSSKGRKHSTHNRHDTGSGPQSTRSRNITQLDGPRGDSSSDESDESSESEVEEEAEGEEDDPLNSDDDAGSDEDDNVWDTDNTIVCQFEKVYRVRAKWKFALKDGIMNLKGHDYIFCRVNGEADW